MAFCTAARPRKRARALVVTRANCLAVLRLTNRSAFPSPTLPATPLVATTKARPRSTLIAAFPRLKSTEPTTRAPLAGGVSPCTVVKYSANETAISSGNASPPVATPSAIRAKVAAPHSACASFSFREIILAKFQQPRKLLGRCRPLSHSPRPSRPQRGVVIRQRTRHWEIQNCVFGPSCFIGQREYQCSFPRWPN